MRKVVCMNDGKVFWFKCEDGKTAIKSMLYFLNLGEKDRSASIKKRDDRWELFHSGKTYACLL